MHAQQKICIVTDQHLSANPRVWKEADTLARNGYDVEIITRANNAQRKKKDITILERVHPAIKYSAVVNAIKEEIPFLKDLFYRSRLKIVLFAKKFGVDSRYLLSTDPDLIYTEALNRNADLYIAHVECGLFVGKHLIQKGKKVAFDFEDWYSRDYLSPVRAVNLLKELELFALQNGVYVSCPSAAMASALKEAYDVQRKPDVIYNGFPDESTGTAPLIKESGKVNVVWFSQRVGPGRGLEKFIEILEQVDSAIKLTLIGDCPEEYEHILQQIFPKHTGHLLEVMKPVPHTQLDGLLKQFDIGLAIEEVYPDSRNKTITNKILQYLQAGIKVFATDTDGQVEVAGYYPNAACTVSANDNSSWAVALQGLIENKIESNEVIEQYNKYFSWVAQEKKLLNLVGSALKN